MRMNETYKTNSWQGVKFSSTYSGVRGLFNLKVIILFETPERLSGGSDQRLLLKFSESIN